MVEIFWSWKTTFEIFFALSSILEPKGAKIVIARNGREALEVLDATSNIDLVLMDVMMPEMDGIQATREIRKRPQWSKLPIIALTGKGDARRSRTVSCGGRERLRVEARRRRDAHVSASRVDAENENGSMTLDHDLADRNRNKAFTRSHLPTFSLRFPQLFDGFAQAANRRCVAAARLRDGVCAPRKNSSRPAKNFRSCCNTSRSKSARCFRDPHVLQNVSRKNHPRAQDVPIAQAVGCRHAAPAKKFIRWQSPLREEGLLDRTILYATDINPDALAKAEAGMYALDRVAAFTEKSPTFGRHEIIVGILRRALRQRGLRSIATQEHRLFRSLASRPTTCSRRFKSSRVATCSSTFDRELQTARIRAFPQHTLSSRIFGIGLARDTSILVSRVGVQRSLAARSVVPSDAETKSHRDCHRHVGRRQSKR